MTGTLRRARGAGARLTDLGYIVHRIDAHPWTTVANMHTAFAKAMSFPSYYGRNLDAFNDVHSDVARFDYGSDPASSGTVLAIAGYDTLARMDRRTAGIVLDIFAVHARLAALYAHPMLCLVESTVTDYPAVGGRPVYFGSVWDLGPDPPAPVHDEDGVENVLQIYADEATASKYVAALHPVLPDTLAAFGRWQILNPVLASECTAALYAKHRPKSPPPGTRLWEIFIGPPRLRGPHRPRRPTRARPLRRRNAFRSTNNQVLHGRNRGTNASFESLSQPPQSRRPIDEPAPGRSGVPAHAGGSRPSFRKRIRYR